MIVPVLLQALLGFGKGARSEPPFNNPPGVDVWCGKAYRETNASFDPGGWLNAPNATNELKLDLRIAPRYNLYLGSQRNASFIVDTPVSYTRGLSYKNQTFDDDSPSTKKPFTELIIQVRNLQTNAVLVDWARIPVNASGIEIEFDLSSMKPSLAHPWTVLIIGNSPDAIQTYTATTTVTVLPERNDTGSVARIDRLYRGIEAKSSLTKNNWKPIFPYSFYTSWDWISSTLNNASATKNLTTFRASGYNLIHPVPPGGSDPFNHTLLEQFLTICDALELYVMYDMRHTYQNTTSITRQLSALQPHPSLLLYYTADEPDGWTDPLNATRLSYTHIRSLDPYHPVSLVLNCANFHFAEYSSGADILLEDTYPIAVNTSVSAVYHTACNATYGDCGCDNCHAHDAAYPAYVHNPFLDIVERVDSLYRLQEWTGRAHLCGKPVWGVPQAFWDAGSFWGRWPSAQEEAVMGVLRVNHGGLGIVAWMYPTSAEIEGVTAGLARVVAGERVVKFLLGARRVALRTVGGEGLLDAAAWVRGGRVLVSVVFQGYGDLGGEVEVRLPVSVDGVEVLWGEGGGWGIGLDGKSLKKEGVKGLEVAILEGRVVG
ncbi:hypothetical protein BDV95DRAFT_665198 [Massariosphaeria phaeospora]|uniref:Glycoside hydrolase superfamily n=1 Tax=Massariosphaeria phaeospora TaxID=100035 RepID=A0A7C8MEL2_9PLEO|nr:hypothetical protein BDV95DRAFT_665198 [Massariosphaeria phaeospora]